MIKGHERRYAMVALEMNDDEAKILHQVVENYHSHLRIEIVGTYRREFRNALKEREKVLIGLIEKIDKAREGG
jgi:hypothetical protein